MNDDTDEGAAFTGFGVLVLGVLVTWFWGFFLGVFVGWFFTK